MNQGDVRLFFEPGVIVTCWPGVLAMADPSSMHHYDMALWSEKSSATIGNATRPDISVLRLVGCGKSVNLRFVYQALLGYEFKASTNL